MKVLRGVIVGESLPKHLGIAYGRHIFRLLHVPGSHSTAPQLYLRDLPMGIVDLTYHGFREPLEAYKVECERVGIPYRERCYAMDGNR